MCTVTYIKTADRVIITSNRDENELRPNACEPRKETINNCTLYFPKDPKAGGTWFAINEQGAVGVLLNGAFSIHQKEDSYVQSRGTVVIQVISDPDPFRKIGELVLTGIEPFTLILYRNERLVELRWDGSQKYERQLNPNAPHIWSSVTLYGPEVVHHREALFSEFMREHPDPDEEDVVRFQSDNRNDSENGFVINRATGLRTFSITQAIFKQQALVMRHLDLRNTKTYQIPINTRNKFLIRDEPVSS